MTTKRHLLWMTAACLVASALVWAADGPLTPLMQLRGRTDANGYLLVSSAAMTGSDGPLTPLANLKGRTDANGYLRMTIANGSATPDTLCLDGTNHDACLVRDAANTLAFRNPAALTTGQIVNVYNTYTDASNYERGRFSWVTNVLTIGTESLGTGTARGLVLKPSGGSITFNTAGSDRWSIGNGGTLQANTDNNYDIGATGSTRPRAIFLGQPSITVGSGTGITVNDTGSVRQLVYKVTIARTAFICAATTCDVTIGTLPAKTFLVHAIADLTTTFACTATCTTATLSATLGKTAGGNEYLLSFDADAAATQFGDAAAELGASLTPATTPTLNGDLASWTATTAVVLRLTSAVGNIGTGAATNLSQGSVTFYLTTVVMP